MPNNYYQITLHLIFAVRNREALISDSFREELHAYIGGIIKNQNQKLLCINSEPDHIHILISLTPDMRTSDLVREIKSESSSLINRKKLCRNKFYWQTGYGVFSHSHSQRPALINYIMNQRQHHQRLLFRQEYLKFLKASQVNCDPEYLFEFFD